MKSTMTRTSIGRRGFLGGAAALGAMTSIRPVMAQDSALKFWDMIWGPSGYIETAEGITDSYQPAAGMLPADYQSVPWNNWYQTFTSAAASGTTPAVSTGAAYLPFPFLEQGVMAPADDLLAKMDAAGQNDFLPGLLDKMRTANGIAALPWSNSIFVMWMRKSLLEEAGADVPTDWQSFLTAGEKLAAIGRVGLALAASSTTTLAKHTIPAFMINNGGGYFAPDGSLDCVNDRNIETLDFLNECVRKKIIDPYAASYTSDNATQDWKNGRIAMGFEQPGMDKEMPVEDRDDFEVISPLKSDRGETGTVYYVNPIMMFTTTPDQASSEAFVMHYLDNISKLWEMGLVNALPVKRSIAELPVIQENPNVVRAINEWQPVGKTIAAQSEKSFGALNAVDGGTATADFVQQIVAGKSDSRQLLSDLQDALARVM